VAEPLRQLPAHTDIRMPQLHHVALVAVHLALPEST